MLNIILFYCRLENTYENIVGDYKTGLIQIANWVSYLPNIFDYKCKGSLDTFHIGVPVEDVTLRSEVL